MGLLPGRSSGMTIASELLMFRVVGGRGVVGVRGQDRGVGGCGDIIGGVEVLRLGDVSSRGVAVGVERRGISVSGISDELGSGGGGVGWILETFDGDGGAACCWGEPEEGPMATV